jgi:hypothetical protein
MNLDSPQTCKNHLIALNKGFLVILTRTRTPNSQFNPIEPSSQPRLNVGQHQEGTRRRMLINLPNISTSDYPPQGHEEWPPMPKAIFPKSNGQSESFDRVFDDFHGPSFKP